MAVLLAALWLCPTRALAGEPPSVIGTPVRIMCPAPGMIDSYLCDLCYLDGYHMRDIYEVWRDHHVVGEVMVVYHFYDYAIVVKRGKGADNPRRGDVMVWKGHLGVPATPRHLPTGETVWVKERDFSSSRNYLGQSFSVPSFSGPTSTSFPGFSGATSTSFPGFSGPTSTSFPGFSGPTSTSFPGFSLPAFSNPGWSPPTFGLPSF
jgi:hypothetical protein